MPFLLDAVSGAIAMFMRFQEVRVAAVPPSTELPIARHRARNSDPSEGMGLAIRIERLWPYIPESMVGLRLALPFGAGCFLPRQGDHR
jgi:hypothetical protein